MRFMANSRIAAGSTAEELTIIHDGGHFVQEDQGDEIGALVADWLANT